MDVVPFPVERWNLTIAGSVCDGCYAPLLRGQGLQCALCPNFNLCNDCVEAKKHFQHREGLIERPQRATAQIHKLVICDSCKGPVYGCRFKCKLCPDYDLCWKCFNRGAHEDTHLPKSTSSAPFQSIKMNDEHSNDLQAILHDICQDLDTEDVLSYLLANEIVQDEQAQELKAIPHKPTRNMQLIAVIKAAGPLAFIEFINALEIFDQGHLAEKLLPHQQSFFTQQFTISKMNTNEHSSQQAGSNTGTTSFASTSNIQINHMQSEAQSNQVAHGNIDGGGESEQNNAFNNQNNQGRMVGGPVHGGHVFLGDNITLNYTGQPSSTSSFIPPQLTDEDWQQILVT
uniref:Uncharacterized protein n=1 Tax=Plectus sambesii TaxID=2011161 RepID=A0A914WD48_9BILA